MSALIHDINGCSTFLARLGVVVLLILSAPLTHAQSSKPDIALIEGLPQVAISCITQDSLGFLWIGTQNQGLYRYDGHTILSFRHSPLDPTSLADDGIEALAPGRGGTLWVGTSRGLHRWDPAAHQFFSIPTGSEDGSDWITALHQSSDGTTWVGTYAGLLSLMEPQASSFADYHIQPIPGLQSQQVSHLYQDHAGILWIGTLAGSIYRYAPAMTDTARTVQTSEGLGGMGAIQTIAEDNKGTLWIGTYAGLMILDPSTNTFISPPGSRENSVPRLQVRALGKSDDGGLWIGTWGKGLYQLKGSLDSDTIGPKHTSQSVSAINGLPPLINTLYRDHSNVLWIGTSEGLYRRSVQRHFLSQVAATDTLQGITALIEDHAGTLWIGTRNQGLYSYEPTAVQPHLIGPWFAPPSSAIWALHYDSKGTIWVGTFGKGIYRLDPETGQTAILQHLADDPASIPNDQVTAIAEDHTGTLWVGTFGGGLASYDAEGARFVPYLLSSTMPDAPALDQVLTLLSSPGTANLWVGTTAGLYRLKPTSDLTLTDPQDVTRIGPLHSPRVFALYMDPEEDDILWIGTPNGLEQMKMRAQQLAYYTGPEDKHTVVQDIASDTQGRLWLSLPDGLARFDPTTNTFWSFESTENALGNAIHPRPILKSRFGPFYVGREDGLWVFNPDSLSTTETPPLLALTDFRIRGNSAWSNKAAALTQQKKLELTYNENYFSFDFSVLDFRDPERNQYRYRLHGLEEDWQNAGHRWTATYTNVPPGTYSFQAQGAGPDGVWNEAGILVPLTIIPPVWQRWWFYLLVVLFITGTLYGMYAYRIARIRQMEAMRRRIAQDLHDDIGGDLSTIAIMSEMVRGGATLNDRQNTMLSDVEHTARKLVADMRDIVWFVHPDYDQLDNMVNKMEEVADTMLAGHNYTFESPPTVLAGTVDMLFRRNIFLIYKEILHNVVRHAQAKCVAIRIAESGGTMVFTVTDDGTGFDLGARRSGSGLRNLQKRAEQIGGHLDIQSQPGEGTIVILRVKTP